MTELSETNGKVLLQQEAYVAESFSRKLQMALGRCSDKKTELSIQLVCAMPVYGLDVLVISLFQALGRKGEKRASAIEASEGKLRGVLSSI